MRTGPTPGPNSPGPDPAWPMVRSYVPVNAEDLQVLGLLIDEDDPAVRRHGDAGDLTELVIGVARGLADRHHVLEHPGVALAPHRSERVLHKLYARAVLHRAGPVGGSARLTTARGGEDQCRTVQTMCCA